MGRLQPTSRCMRFKFCSADTSFSSVLRLPISATLSFTSFSFLTHSTFSLLYSINWTVKGVVELFIYDNHLWFLRAAHWMGYLLRAVFNGSKTYRVFLTLYALRAAPILQHRFFSKHLFFSWRKATSRITDMRYIRIGVLDVLVKSYTAFSVEVHWSISQILTQ